MAQGRNCLKPVSQTLRFLLGLIFIVAISKQVAAQPDSQICCLKAAREAWNSSSTTLPWDSCAFGASYVQGSIAPGSVPQVTATMSFCKQACPGFRLSNLTEWLLLLTTWVIPAIALLIICSTGECKEVQERRIITPKGKNPSPFYQYVINPINNTINKAFGWLPDAILEFIAILGDPASAIRGAFSEIALDVRVIHDLSRGNQFDRMMRALAMVAGQTRLDEDTEIRLTNVLISKGLLVATDPFKDDHRIQKLRKYLLMINVNKEPTRFLAKEELRKAAIQHLRPALICSEEHRRSYLNTCLEALKSFLEKDKSEFGYSTQPNDLEAAKSSQDIEANRKRLEMENKLRQDLIQAISDVLSPSKEPEKAAIQPTETEDEIKADTREKGGFESAVIETEPPQIAQSKGDDTLFEQSDWAKGLKMGIKVGLKGRVDFMKALVVPVALSLVATAGSFYTAYTTLGDNDTAHSLAYGTWFSWIIILAVASNCYIATANPGLVKLALQDEVYLSEVTVPLRERANNTRKWTAWLKTLGCEDTADRSLVSPSQTKSALKLVSTTQTLTNVGSRILSFPFKQTPGPSPKPEGFLPQLNLVLHLIVKQFAGWVCVALPCACAASISYTTPTIGLGCRSFNHMLYGILTFFISIIAVIRAYLSYYDTNFTTRVLFRALYIVGIGINNFVLVFGTLFHLIGLYRSCVCAVLGVGGDFLLQISAITPLDVASAKKFWLPVGYMDFGFVWIICCVAVGCRGYIHYHIKLFFEEKNGEEGK